MKLDLADLRALSASRAEFLENIRQRLVYASADVADAIPATPLADGDAAIAAARLEPIAREVLSLGASLLAHASAYQTLALVDRCSVAAPPPPRASAAPKARAGRSRRGR